MRIRPTDEDVKKAKKLNQRLKLVEEVNKKYGRKREWPLYWNFIGQDQAQDSLSMYYFLIVNTDKREIEDIQGMIHGQVKFGTLSIENRIDGKVLDLNYRYLQIRTQRERGGAVRIDLGRLARIYRGKIEKDNRLYESPKRGTVEITNYIEGKLEGKLGI